MNPHEIEFLRHNITTIVSSGTQADNKAQALLGFTGIFVNLSFGVFLTAGGNTKMPGVLFITMIIFYIGSIIFSIIARCSADMDFICFSIWALAASIWVCMASPVACNSAKVISRYVRALLSTLMNFS